MTELERIAALTVEDVYKVLLDRILDLSVVPEGEEWVTLHEDEQLPFYDRIIVHPTLVKPPVEMLDSELADYKAELTAVEEARLAEIARVEDFTARLEALEEFRMTMVEAGLNQPNAKLLKKSIIEDNRLVDLEALEAANVLVVATKAAKEAAEERRKLGRQARTLIDTLLDTIAGYNIQNDLTDAQLDQMEVDFADALSALKNRRPKKAKKEFDKISVDGVLVTQEMKDELYAILAAAGIE